MRARSLAVAEFPALLDYGASGSAPAQNSTAEPLRSSTVALVGLLYGWADGRAHAAHTLGDDGRAAPAHTGLALSVDRRARDDCRAHLSVGAQLADDAHLLRARAVRAADVSLHE